MRATITVQGSTADEDSLREWLRREPDVRGHLAVVPGPGPAGTMGPTSDLVVQVAATAAGATAVWAALARSLTVWLTQRRSDLSVTITGPKGRTVVVEAKRVADVQELMQRIVEAVQTGSKG